MNKLIAIDDGHGMETAGKRSPDGVLRENDFNRAVAALLDRHLKRCGFRTLLVAPGDKDISLSARAAAANKAKADFYISVHANAAGAGWSTARGIETFHFPGSSAGKKAAEVLHRHLLAGTALPNRGVKSAAFAVLEKTTMPAVLVECGFMSNRVEAALLMSAVYRAECAEELARGICELYGVAYVRETQPLPVSNQVGIRVNGKLLADKGTLKDGVTSVPVRAVAEALGAGVMWDGDAREVLIDDTGK